MTASRPDFIIADQPAKPAPKSSARTLKGLVADLSTPTTRDAAHDCLAATIYHESRAEPLEGQLAVAEVVINRTQSPSFRRTICGVVTRSEEHTSELQSLMRISYAVFCLKKKKHYTTTLHQQHPYKISTT